MTSRPRILRRLVLVLAMTGVTMFLTFLPMVAAGPASAGPCNSGGRIVNFFGTVSLSDCTITMNSTSGSGGGVENHDTMILTNVVISNNSADGDGGGIYNAGTMTLTNVVVTGNTAAGVGGGIQNDGGTVFMSNVTVTGNGAGTGGGGIANVSGSMIGAAVAVGNNTTTTGDGGGILNGGSFCLSTGTDFATCSGPTASPSGGNSLVTGNIAKNGNGGGIANPGGTVTLSDSTVDGNQAVGGSGGGIWNVLGTIQLVNATISNNTADGNGGGILNDTGAVCCASGTNGFATNVTIARNTAGGSGGGVYTTSGLTIFASSTIADNSGVGVYNDDTSFAFTELLATLLARNGTNCVGTIASDGYNLDTGASCALAGTGDQQNVGDANVGLGTLAANGGPTQGSSTLSAPMMTQALDRTSPAVDAGGPTCPATDERGVARPQDGNQDGIAACDIGAFERPATCYDLIALSTQGRKSFDFSGTAHVQFCGGGVWSNSGAEASNNSVPTQAAACNAPVFTSSGKWIKKENLTGSGFIVDEQTQPPIADPLGGTTPPAMPPTCGGVLTSGPVLVSGVSCYTSITVAPGRTLNLVGDPTRNDNVVYVIGGAKGLSVRGAFSASNVLIYVANGDIDLNAQAVSNLQPNLTGGPWHGFMLWVADGNSIRLNGGAHSQWTGTIYGPGSHIVINGGSASSLRSIVIGATIDFAGTDSTVMSCDPGSNFPAADIIP
jgi:predicted outer membrane repeat protein